MTRVNNDAVILEINVDIDWYRMGYHFVDTSSENQKGFLTAFTQGINEWSTYSRLQQFDAIAELFAESPYRLELASHLQELVDRLNNGK